MFHGFVLTFPSNGYYIVPVRVNGSTIESYISRLKFSTHGQLSAINYSSAQAAVEMAKSVLPIDHMKLITVDIKPVGLKRRK